MIKTILKQIGFSISIAIISYFLILIIVVFTRGSGGEYNDLSSMVLGSAITIIFFIVFCTMRIISTLKELKR